MPESDTIALAAPLAPVGSSLSLGRLLRRREVFFWALQAIGWGAYFTAQFVSALFYPEKFGPARHTGYLYVLIVAAASGFAISSVLRYIYRRVRDRSPGVVAATVIAIVYVAALVWRLFINGAYVVFMSQEELLDGWARIFAGGLISMYLLMCWSAMYFGIYYYESVQREREATLKATALAQQAQIKMLRYQLNPHFLFNTLNAISTLILDRDTDTANQTVTRLSAFLRHTLDQDPMKRVTLKQELEALDLYLGIETLRFGSRLKLVYAIEPGAMQALVPSLLLQPLIENALKYAIAPSEAGGTVEIGAHTVGEFLRMHVADSGPGIRDPAAPGTGRGVGLRNTRERLAVLYGERARMERLNTHPGLRVEIQIPLELPS
jgi:signal transduction histidine kinase